MMVKLTKLIVLGLHGCYDYTVEFNSDVTFLYGMNGCGKTTILNITEAIITGKLFRLFDYKFKSIKLYYVSAQTYDDAKSIIIRLLKNKLQIKFNGQDYEVDKELYAERDLPRFRLEHYYFDEYDFLDDIKNTFNYVYLPLNRSAVLHEYESINLERRRRTRYIDSETNSVVRDLSMENVVGLVNRAYANAISKISRYNDEFRNEILKSLLQVPHKYDAVEILSNMKLTVSDLEKITVSYMNMLKEFDLLNKKEEQEYYDYFTGLINKVEEKGDTGRLLTLQEISSIRKVLAIAEKMERRKAEAKKPIETFLKTINDFIKDSDDDKTLNIDSHGGLYFTTKYNSNRIHIQRLSSGEKQLVTFFANLIFKLKSGSAGIFVVDEPELSLHLAWQKTFVEKALAINNNVQLIFATHSPEIVGRYREKMYKLEKKHVERHE